LGKRHHYLWGGRGLVKQEKSVIAKIDQNISYLDKLRKTFILKKEERVRLGEEIMKKKVEKILIEGEAKRRLMKEEDIKQEEEEELNSNDDLTGREMVNW
jgi:hypothetical protein